MEFLSEYYLWFVIGGIILVMALIGYIADKTDFGRKDITSKQPKKVKDKPKKNVEQENTVDKVEEPMIEQPVSDISDEALPTVENDEKPTDISDIDPFVMPEVTEEIQLDNMIQVTDDTLNKEMQNDEDIEIKEVTDDSTFALNNDLSVFEASDLVNPIASAETVDSNVAEVIGEDIPVETANDVTNDTSTSTLEEQDSEEDIWKF